MPKNANPNPQEIFTQLTHWDSVTASVKTVNGSPSYIQWCRDEAARINAIPGRFAYLCKNDKTGKIALWVNQVTKNVGERDTPFEDLQATIMGPRPLGKGA